jgi:hypothetical protein
MILMQGTPWAQGGSLDKARPSAQLVRLLDRASGPDRKCKGMTDDELTGLLGRWAATEAWVASARLGVIVELVRRRGVDGLGTRGDEVPLGWDDTLAEEIMAALAMSRPAAQAVIDLAVTLATRLPLTAAALEAGEVDYLKAKIIADVTCVLAEDAARNAEKLAVDWAGGTFAGKTPGEIRKLTERAAIVADPGAAENRREEAEKCSRVETWRETTGTMAISAVGLNPQTAMEAGQAIQDRALAYKKAGFPGDMDNLRVQAMTDKLIGKNPLSAGPGEEAGLGDRGLAVKVNLTLPALVLPLLTVLGVMDNPGEAVGLGAIDPGLVRDLAASAALAGRRSEWHLTLVDENGWAVGHGCAAWKPRAAATRTDTSLTLTLPGGDSKTFDMHPIPVYDCDHRYESEGHDPSPLLRHLTEIRDGTCVQIGCHRPAIRCDFEHAIPFEKGGKTCGCNGGPKCRRDHQIKQNERWQVVQIAPGFHQWTVPSGRVYTRGPVQYPA